MRIVVIDRTIQFISCAGETPPRSFKERVVAGKSEECGDVRYQVVQFGGDLAYDVGRQASSLQLLLCNGLPCRGQVEPVSGLAADRVRDVNERRQRPILGRRG